MGNLVLWINYYWKQQTENNKIEKMSFNLLKTVTSSSIFCINWTHFNQSQTQITVMSELFFWWSFSLNHVIINTIITSIALWLWKKSKKRTWYKRTNYYFVRSSLFLCLSLWMKEILLFMNFVKFDVCLLFRCWDLQCLESNMSGKSLRSYRKNENSSW